MNRFEIAKQIDRLQESKKGKDFKQRLEIAAKIDQLREQIKNQPRGTN